MHTQYKVRFVKHLSYAYDREYNKFIGLPSQIFQKLSFNADTTRQTNVPNITQPSLGEEYHGMVLSVHVSSFIRRHI